MKISIIIFTSTILLFLNNTAAGQIRDETSSRLPFILDYSLKSAIADFDNDGNTDIVLANNAWGHTPGNETFLYNIGGGFFEDSSAVYFSSFDDLSFDIDTFDFDFNGYPDILVTNAFFDISLIYYNYDDSLFRPVTIPSFSYYISLSSAVGDIDRDFDVDIVVGIYEDPPYTDGRDIVFVNDGSGNFFADPARMPDLPLGERELHLTDVDADLDLDLLMLEYTSQIWLLLNDGNGYFYIDEDSLNPRLPILDRCLCYDIGDIDMDGDIDIGYYTVGNRIRILANDGMGYFSLDDSTRMPPYYDGARDLEFGDFNNDGLPDLFVAVSADIIYSSRLFLNIGNGYFIDATDSLMPNIILNVGDAQSGDVDDDGDLDVFMTFPGIGQNHLLINYSEPDNTAPFISSVTIHNDTVFQGPYPTFANCDDNIGAVDSSGLFFTLNDDPFEYIELLRLGETHYGCILPSVQPGTCVSYYFRFRDREGNTSLFPPGAPDSTIQFCCLQETDIIQPGNSREQLKLETKIYPNPTNGMSFISIISNDISGRVSIAIFDILGRKINSEEHTLVQLENNRFGLNKRLEGVEYLSSGMYFVVCEQGYVREVKMLQILK